MTAQAPTVHVPRRAFPWGKLAAWIALGILLVVTLFPFYWMLRTALTKSEVAPACWALAIRLLMAPANALLLASRQRSGSGASMCSSQPCC